MQDVEGMSEDELREREWVEHQGAYLLEIHSDFSKWAGVSDEGVDGGILGVNDGVSEGISDGLVMSRRCHAIPIEIGAATFFGSNAR